MPKAIYKANDFKTIFYVSCSKDYCVFLSHNEIFNSGLKACFTVIKTFSTNGTMIHINKP